jgi:hypothetical protein
MKEGKKEVLRTNPRSGIQCPFDPWFRDPGWKKFGFGIGDKHPGSATLEKRKVKLSFIDVFLIGG